MGPGAHRRGPVDPHDRCAAPPRQTPMSPTGWNTDPMNTGSQQHQMRAWLLPFLAALIAALAAILTGLTAPAAATVGAENRVGAISHIGKVPVEPPQHITPGQRLGEAAPGHGIVVATGVAANGGIRATRQAYVDSARAISDDGLARVAAGDAPDAVARSVVDSRNALKLEARQKMPGPLNKWAEWRNTRRYGNPVGPTYEGLISRPGATDIGIIQRAGNTSGWINWLLGVQ